MADEDSNHAAAEETSQASVTPGAGIRLLSRLMYAPKSRQESDGQDKTADESFVLPFLWPLW